MDHTLSTPITDERGCLLNRACACLIHEPKTYASAASSQTSIYSLACRVSQHDPEFILKLALYVRDDLNIRSTANYLLAIASSLPPCHPFLKKYFLFATRLPGDVVEVISLYHTLPNRLPKDGAIPTVLRKAIARRFIAFDMYQLAKHNNERALKRKAKKQKTRDARSPKRSPSHETPEPALVKLTLKQLIRKVHISEPAEAVMGIVGKKYPSTKESFESSGLSGSFDATRIGKRMKLPMPETWETFLSLKGNKHTTWEELIDHEKLPFMAMLRNLRNMLTTGISPKHHGIILAKLTDEQTVAKSRQLPWQFLSAYQALNIDLEKMMNDMLDADEMGDVSKNVHVRTKGNKGRQMDERRTIKKKAIIPVHMPDHPLIERYRKALDTAVRLATLHNLPQVLGKSVVFCDVSGSMARLMSSSKKIGSIQNVSEVAILLGLMLQDSCEECDFRIFSSPPNSNSPCHMSVKLEPNSILFNIERVVEKAQLLGGGTDFPFDYLEDLIARKVSIDQFVILSDMMIAPGMQEMGEGRRTVSNILARYRREVNPNLLFITVDLAGYGISLTEGSAHPNDILITGWSDNILRFISERSSNKQLQYVMEIDKKKNLDARMAKSDSKFLGGDDKGHGKRKAMEMDVEG